MPGAGGPGSCSTVAGEVRSKGTELDVGGDDSAGLERDPRLYQQDVRITKSYPGDTTNTVGAFQQLTPRTIVNLSTNYEFQHGSLKGFKIGGGAHYNGSEAPVDATGLGIGQLLPRISGYTTVDLYGSYEFQYNGAKMNAGSQYQQSFRQDLLHIRGLRRPDYRSFRWGPPLRRAFRGSWPFERGVAGRSGVTRFFAASDFAFDVHLDGPLCRRSDRLHLGRQRRRFLLRDARWPVRLAAPGRRRARHNFRRACRL